MSADTRRPPRERGFTMIEVLVALAITAIGVVGIMALYISQTRSSSFSRHSTEATSLAMDKLEELRTQVPVNSTDTVDAQGNAGGIYTRTWTVNTVSTGTGDSHELQVVVSWDGDDGTRSVTVTGGRN